MLRIHRVLLARFQSLIALAMMVLAMSLLSGRFLTAENGWNILRQISVNLCLSIGMTLVILAAESTCRWVPSWRCPELWRRDY